MKRKELGITKFSVLIITLVMLVAVTAVSVFAAYLKNSEEVKNIFKPADSVTPEIVEIFEEDVQDNVKENVHFKVGNTDYPVYVRAAIVITWQDKDKTVYFSKPNETAGDYTMSLNLTDWELKDDGFYYFKAPVKSGGETSNLIYECRQLKEAPVEGYTLCVEILVQTIQAIGSTDGENGVPEKDAWEDAEWSVS